MADQVINPAEQLDAVRAEMEQIINRAQTDARELTDEESKRFDLLDGDAKEIVRQIEVADAERARKAQEATARQARLDELATRMAPSRVSVSEPNMYDRKSPNSFFLDLARMHKGDYQARDRMYRYGEQRNRALNTTAGTGGEFAPPVWMIDEWIKLARPGRPTANLMPTKPVPKGLSSIHIPRIKTGTSVGVQGTQNTAISQTDLTTDAISVSFTTLAGGQVISQQVIDQTPAVNFDDVVLQDLAADYAHQVNQFTLNTASTGLAALADVNTVTFTGTATGAAFVAALYRKVAGAIAKINTTRYAPPTHIIMHPNRWYDIISTFDSSNRPLVVPAPVAFNPVATADGLIVEGPAGNWLGLTVVLDNDVPTNLGTGANQDEIYVVRAPDALLMESPVTAGVFEQTYANQLSLFVRLYAYVGFAIRHGSSASSVSGTNMIDPTF
ncbi:MAG: phage major capsid protein [Propionibacterium sp.]|nr:phage major capsid protein [Propionibacterium sp.]